MNLTDAKILISDDSILARKKLKDLVTAVGVRNIIEAGNGQEAIDRYKEYTPDLVFLDIVMPVKDGHAAISEIKEVNPKADIVVVSSVGTQTQLRKAIELGAGDFIQKPLNQTQVTSILKSRFKGGA